jgi:hypothetical protein
MPNHNSVSEAGGTDREMLYPGKTEQNDGQFFTPASLKSEAGVFY